MTLRRLRADKVLGVRGCGAAAAGEVGNANFLLFFSFCRARSGEPSINLSRDSNVTLLRGAGESGVPRRRARAG